jgi:uracil-DNA glycosylase
MPTGKITRDQGKIFRLDDKLLMPMFHPAAALRGTKNLNEFKAGFLKLKKLLEKGFISE